MKFYIDKKLQEINDFKVDASKNSSEKEDYVIDGQQITLLTKHPFTEELLVKINGKTVVIKKHTKYDEAKITMGYSDTTDIKTNVLKAPMPGVVLQVHVQVGDTIKKGDPLLTLEAMKMENILKATNESVVKAVHVMIGNSVNKNQVLLEME